jgi:glycosyltransferase involved in cell wall biosynthesis
MEPVVTCTMVTRPGERLAHVKRAIGYFAAQTQPDKELVIALDAGSEADKAAVESHVAGLGRDDVHVHRAPGQPSLGQLRNFAISRARGQLVAVWDDDDVYHPQRLEQQVNQLRGSGAIATFLTEVLHLLLRRREVFCTNYRNTVQKCVPGSGLFRRDVAARYPEVGAESLRGEDTVFTLQLMAEGRVHLVDDAAHLYTYVHHGLNTSGDAHHDMLARTLSVSRGKLVRREERIREALSLAGLGLAEVEVKASNGVAFVWKDEARLAAVASEGEFPGWLTIPADASASERSAAPGTPPAS